MLFGPQCMIMKHVLLMAEQFKASATLSFTVQMTTVNTVQTQGFALP